MSAGGICGTALRIMHLAVYGEDFVYDETGGKSVHSQ